MRTLWLGGTSSTSPPMFRREWNRTVLISLGLFLAGLLSIHTQNYSIDWYKISGGGGTSSNSQYTISGTVRQRDAGGPMSGGNYSLTGGFWALYAAQTPGAPLLKIFLTTAKAAVVSWAYPSTGWNSQQNSNLSTMN